MNSLGSTCIAAKVWNSGSVTKTEDPDGKSLTYQLLCVECDNLMGDKFEHQYAANIDHAKLLDAREYSTWVFAACNTFRHVALEIAKKCNFQNFVTSSPVWTFYDELRIVLLCDLFPTDTKSLQKSNYGLFLRVFELPPRIKVKSLVCNFGSDDLLNRKYWLLRDFLFSQPGLLLGCQNQEFQG